MGPALVAGVLTEPPAQHNREDLRRSERVMVRIRAGGAAFAVVQVLAYQAPDSLPEYVVPGGLALAAVLALAAALTWFLDRRITDVGRARALALGGLIVDILVVSSFVWLFTFDPDSALWAVLYVVPLEGAIRFQFAGALGSWAATTAGYALREVWGSQHFGYPLLWNSITFRMGIALLIAFVAGYMAHDLTERRAQVEAALADLRRVDGLRRHLVSTLAHDVRSPLTTIRGALQTLLDRTDVPPMDARSLLVAADRQAARLQYLAADLLDLARLEEGKLTLEIREVHLAEVVARGLRYTDPEGRFTTSVPPDLQAFADERRLEQVIVNLTDNAQRHGSPPLEITAARCAGGVELRVADQGPGLPSSGAGRHFEPFESTDDHSSVGLGLWVCRLLVEAHGGTITYRRVRGTTSVFCVFLPDVPASANPVMQ